MASRSWFNWTFVVGAISAFVVAGFIVQPVGAMRKWSIQNRTANVSDGENALQIAKAGFARYRPFQNLFIVSFKLEAKEIWDTRSYAGCNDKWIVSARSLYGLELGRAAYLCSGVDSYWI